MGALGDLLELLHGAGGSYRTLRLRAREWQHIERSARALDGWHDAQRSSSSVAAPVAIGIGATKHEPEEYESTIALWLAPQRARAAAVREGGTYLTVIDGDRWWRHNPHLGAISNEGSPNHQTGAATDDLGMSKRAIGSRQAPVGHSHRVVTVDPRENEGHRGLVASVSTRPA
jgi:hypothetical protein